MFLKFLAALLSTEIICCLFNCIWGWPFYQHPALTQHMRTLHRCVIHNQWTASYSKEEEEASGACSQKLYIARPLSYIHTNRRQINSKLHEIACYHCQILFLFYSIDPTYWHITHELHTSLSFFNYILKVMFYIYLSKVQCWFAKILKEKSDWFHERPSCGTYYKSSCCEGKP